MLIVTDSSMHLTAELKQKLEAKEKESGIGIDILSNSKLTDISVPVILKCERNKEEEEKNEEEELVVIYDLEPLIDYFVCHIRKSGNSNVPHPVSSIKTQINLSNIEAVTGDGINENNEQEVLLLLLVLSNALLKLTLYILYTGKTYIRNF